MNFERHLFLLEVVKEKVVHLNSVLRRKVEVPRTSMRNWCRLDFVLKELVRYKQRGLRFREQVQPLICQVHSADVDFKHILAYNVM